MKNNLFNILGAGMMLALLATACTDGFEELNENPNEPSAVPTNYLLTYAQEDIIDRIYNGFDNSRIGMTLAQYWSQNQYTDESRYQYRPQTNNTSWDDLYTGINNLQEIIRLNEADSATAAAITNNQIAVARILKAWTFQYLTDTYGAIPYEEALDISTDATPAYTPQAEIYPDLINELSEASDQITVDADGFTTGDLIYDGDMSKWKKFANSLKARVAMRMVDALPEQAEQAIEEAVAAGVFESNDDIAAVRYLTSQPSTFPLYDDYVVDNRQDFSSSDVLVEELQQRNDPRLGRYFEPAEATGTFIGRPFGQSVTNANAQPPAAVSQLNPRVYSPDFPGLLMDYSDLSFILAEAAARGMEVQQSAEAYYAQGIRASMNFWGIDNASAINAYITANPYDGSNYEQSIGVQRWIALYMQGIQGWSVWRRLDFTGVFQLPVDGPLIDIDQVPVRRPYPPAEQSLNLENYRNAVNEQGEDSFTERLWWDVE